MNETLEIALTEMVNGAVATAGTAQTFLKEEIPEVLNQVIAWHFLSAILLALTFTVFLVISLFTIKYAVTWFKRANANNTNEDSWENNPASVGEIMSTLLTVGAVMMVCASLIIIPVGVCKAVKIKVAPKVFLLEYIAHKVKPSTN